MIPKNVRVWEISIIFEQNEWVISVQVIWKWQFFRELWNMKRRGWLDCNVRTHLFFLRVHSMPCCKGQNGSRTMNKLLSCILWTSLSTLPMKKKTRKPSPRKLPSSFVWGGVYDGVKLCDTRKLPKLPRLPSCEITTFFNGLLHCPTWLYGCILSSLGFKEY